MTWNTACFKATTDDWQLVLRHQILIKIQVVSFSQRRTVFLLKANIISVQSCRLHPLEHSVVSGLVESWIPVQLPMRDGGSKKNHVSRVADEQGWPFPKSSLQASLGNLLFSASPRFHQSSTILRSMAVKVFFDPSMTMALPPAEKMTSDPIQDIGSRTQQHG